MTLALKYRPTYFKDLIGQHSISQTLSLALDQNKISNAYLFSGLRGSGKTSSARIFARALQCDQGPTSTPCGICDNCKASFEGRHIDIIEMDAASNRKIDDIRDLIEQTKYKPAFGRFKIFIIDEVHMLTKEAFNALLKTLEEPPDFVKFILATTDPLLMPATILSRTQHFRFKKIPHKSVVEHLIWILEKEKIPYEEEALNLITRSGSGSLRDTLTLLEQAIIFGQNQVRLSATTDMLGMIDPLVLDDFFSAILQKNSQRAEEILEVMQEYDCDMVLDELILFLKDKAMHKSNANHLLSPLLLNRFFNILVQGKTLLSLNSDGEFVLLLCLLKMQEATKLQDVQSLIQSLEKTTLQEIPKLASCEVNYQDHTEGKREPIAPLLRQDKEESKTLFQSLIQMLYDRNYHLGQCFEKNLAFLSFENQVLTLQFLTDDENEKQALREQYALIKAFIVQIYGDQTQVKFEAFQATLQEQENVKKSSQDEISANIQKSDDELLDQDDKEAAGHTMISSSKEMSPESSQTTNLSFSSRNQVLLGHLKKHLQVDLSTAKKI